MVLKMSKDKTLSMTKAGNTYKSENNAESIKILIPRKINNVDLNRCSVYLCVKNKDALGDVINISAILKEHSDDLLCADIDVTKEITYISGEVLLWIKIINPYNNMVMKTNPVICLVKDHLDIEDYIPEQKLSLLDDFSIRMDKLAEKTELLSTNTPKIIDGTWWVWNAETGEYEDTGEPAKGYGSDGKTPERGVDYWTEEDKTEIVNDVLKNIPKDDGSAFANALKGNSTGEIVSITDVSPVEHEIDVKVKGKNLVGIPNIVPNMEENKIISIPCYITEPIVISGVNDNAVVQDSSGNPKDIWRMQVVHQSGLKEPMMDSNFATGRKYTKASTSNPIIEIQYRSTYLVSGQYKDIQVEYGDVATSYAPYIPDLSAVNVISHGKNLFDISKIENTKTVTNNSDGSLSVTTYANSVGKTFGELCPDLKVGSTITLSANTTGNTFVFLLAPANITVTFGKPVVVTQDILDSVLSVYGKSPTEEDMSAVIKDIQVEYGNTVTEYEPYTEPTFYPVNADGTVDGVKSVYPETILTTDTSGVILDCVYNRDINKAFAQLQNAIISLGGNV